MNYQFEAVWMTTQASGTPHAAALQEANPGLVMHVCQSPQGEGEARKTMWRNCDRNIREWWAGNRDTVKSDSVLFLEYDVFCNVDLRRHITPLSKECGIAAAKIISGLTEIRNFWPFSDIPLLPRGMQALACATAPLAVLLISRSALDAVLHPLHDAIFSADIFCETRLPTVVRFEGFGVASMDLAQVVCTPQTPTYPGIWHPVKIPVSERS